MLKNTSNSFGSVAKAFHWLIALGIIGMLIVGFIMADMNPSSTKYMLYGYHKSTGVLILLFVGLRLIWRFLNPTPQLPKTLRPWHHHVAKLSPIALYSLMFLMPLSGTILSQAGGHPITIYGLFTLPNILPKLPALSKVAGMVHEYGAFAFIGILTLHVGAALYHHFIIKTNILRRMMPSWLQRS